MRNSSDNDTIECCRSSKRNAPADSFTNQGGDGSVKVEILPDLGKSIHAQNKTVQAREGDDRLEAKLCTWLLQMDSIT